MPVSIAKPPAKKPKINSIIETNIGSEVNMVAPLTLNYDIIPMDTETLDTHILYAEIETP